MPAGLGVFLSDGTNPLIVRNNYPLASRDVMRYAPAIVAVSKQASGD